MAIASNNTVTWADLTAACIDALKNVCCNIDSFAGNVPMRLKSGQGQVEVKSITTTVSAGGTAQTHRWYANPSNLIYKVTSSTVNSEWSEFLSKAGIDARSNKVCQAKEVGLVIGLFQQFMAFHVKRIHSRRQIYNTLETNPGIFQGNKYITGTCTPKYTLTAIEKDNIPEVTDTDITNLINQAIYWPGNNWGMLDSTSNPVLHRCYLS